jgi:hypothetical protein
MDKCKSCDADIIWSRSTKGKWMPLDAIRVGHGVRFVVSEDGTAYSEVVAHGHTSHFATCTARQKPTGGDDQGELDV